MSYADYNSSQDSLPASLYAETAILGAMMIDSVAIADATPNLLAGDFSLDSHRRIYAAIIELIHAGKNVDTITVRDELTRKRSLDATGGPAYLAGLTNDLPRNLNVQSYVRIVREKSLLRQMMTLFQEAGTRAADQGEDPITLLQSIMGSLTGISEQADGDTVAHVSAAMPPASPGVSPLAESLTVLDGIPFGFAEVDAATGGAHRGDLIVVAGRPSMGKTAMLATIARSMAVNAAASGVVFSMEQKRQDIVRRMLSGASRADYQDIRKGTVRPYEQTLLDEHWQTLSQTSLFIDDKPGLTVSRVRARCVKLKRSLEAGGKTLDFVIIDQLSKIASEGPALRMQRREQVGEITKALKALAQELDIPVILLVQIGRESMKRTDSRPTLADLKDSGNIEEDADGVILLHRPEYYDKTDEALRGKGEIIIAKQREGPTRTCEVLYQGRIMRWEDAPDTPAQQNSFYGYER